MNVTCSNTDSCAILLSSKCVIYEGSSLVYTGINTNDSIQIALQKIDATIASTIGSGGTVTSVAASGGTGISVTGSPITTSGTLTIVNTLPDLTVSLTQGSGITITGTYPNFTIANSSPSSGGTVTNVSALTLGTSGTDLTSSVANSTTTPVITLNVPTASASNRGALSSADWTTFSNKQASGNYITALTGEATASGPGSVAITLGNSAVISKVLTGLNIIGSNILATDSILEAFGKTQNQINALAGGLNYQGTWNATTNSPTLTSSVGTQGYYYKVSVAGNTTLNGNTGWQIGDLVLFNGAEWDKVDNTDSVSSVNGFTGAVNLTTADISEGGGILYFNNARAIASTLTGYTSGAGTISATDTILSAIQKLNGNALTLSAFSATSPIFYNNTTGVISSQAASATDEGYITTGTQIFVGTKTFNANIIVNAGIASSDVLPITTNTYNLGDSLTKWQNIYVNKIGNLTSNGLVKTTSGTGTLAISTVNVDYASNPLTTNGDIIYAVGIVPTRLAAGTSTQVLHGGSIPSWSVVSLTTDVSGILPIANGGTGSATQNFVDLTTAQNIAGNKTFTSTDRYLSSASGVTDHIDRINTSNVALTSYMTGGTGVWSAGMNSGDSNYNISRNTVGNAMTINSSTLAATFAGALSASNLSLAGNFTMSGAFPFTGTVTAPTAVTFPTSGTLLTTTGSGASLTNVVHTTGNETISGEKTFNGAGGTSASIVVSAASAVNSRLRLDRFNGSVLGLMDFSTGGSFKWALGMASASNDDLSFRGQGVGVGTTDYLTFNWTAGTVTTNAPALFSTLTAGGLVKAASTTGQLSIATAGTDYMTPAGVSTTYVPYTGATSDVDLGTHKLATSVSGSAVGIDVATSSSSAGIRLSATSSGTGLDISGSSTGYAQLNHNTSSGYGLGISNTSTGIGLHIDNSTAASGRPFVISKNGVANVLFSVDNTGALTGTTAKFTDGATKGTGSVADANILGFQSVYSTNSSSSFKLGSYSYVDQTVATSGSIQGLEGQTILSHTSGTVVAAIATIGNIQVNGSGGTTTWARSVQGGGAITAGTVTNWARFYASAGSGSPSNNFSFYSESGAGIGSIADGLTLGGALIGTSATLSGIVTGVKFTGTNGTSLLAAPSNPFAVGVQYNNTTGAFYLGATNSATPDGLLSNGNGDVVMKLGYNQVVTITTLGTGAVQATAGVLSVVSDSKAKDVFGKMKAPALSVIANLDGGHFWNYNAKSKLGKNAESVKQFGLLADRVHAQAGELAEQLAPTQGTYNDKGKFTPTLIDGKPVYGLNTTAIIAVLVQSIQELQAEVKALK